MTTTTAAAVPDERRRVLVTAGIVATVVAVLAARRFSGDDLQVYRAAGRALLDGVDPYAGPIRGTWIPFSYTPFSTAVFFPLALLAKPVAMFLVTLLSLGCLWFAMGRVVDAVWADRSDDSRLHITAGVCALLLLAEPVTETLGLGQMNYVLMAMVVGDVMRRRDSRWQGVWIGVATAFKLTPGIFIIYLLVTRRVRAAVTAAASFAVTIAVGFVVMPRGSVTYWFHGVGTDPGHVGQVNYIPNQSVLGSLSRIIGYGAARPWWMVACVPILAGGIWLTIQAHRRWGDVGGLASIAFVGALVSPYSWSHHFTWFAFPALLIAERAVRLRSRRLGLLCGLWCAPFFLGPFWFVPESAWHLDHHPAWQAIVGSAYTLTTIVGFAVVAWLVTRPGSGARHGHVADDQAREVVTAR